MYVPSNELTLSEDEVVRCAEWLCAAGFDNDLAFQSRPNRDAVAKEAKARGARVKLSRIANQSIDPRYTTEGKLAGLPDKGLGNDRIMTTLYIVERTL